MAQIWAVTLFYAFLEQNVEKLADYVKNLRVMQKWLKKMT